MEGSPRHDLLHSKDISKQDLFLSNDLRELILQRSFKYPFIFYTNQI